MTLFHRAASYSMALLCFVALVSISFAETLVGFNFIGTNTLDTHYATGPGIGALETVSAPQGSSALYQRRLVAIEWLQPTNTALGCVSAVFLGSQNVENQLTPVNLQGLPGEIVCDVWTNGLTGLYAKPQQPDLEFNAGSTLGLSQVGTVTNDQNSTAYPIFLVRANPSGATNFILVSGLKYAASLRLRYAATTNITVRICKSVNTNGAGGLVRTFRSGYWDTISGTNDVPLPALAVEFSPIPGPVLTFQPLTPAQFRLALTNDPYPYAFVRFEFATNLKPPINWSTISGIGNPPSATGSFAGQQMFFRSVFK